MGIQSKEADLGDSSEELSLENELALLVLFRGLVRLVVFPTNHLTAATARYVADDVTACRHITLGLFGGVDVDDIVEKVGFAMLATEVLQ